MILPRIRVTFKLRSATGLGRARDGPTQIRKDARVVVSLGFGGLLSARKASNAGTPQAPVTLPVENTLPDHPACLVSSG